MHWTKKAVIAGIKAQARERGYALSTENTRLYQAAKLLYGSWGAACAAAKVPPAKSCKHHEVQTDCLLYNREQKACKGLDRLYCKHEKCGFFKLKTDENSAEYAQAMAEMEAVKYKKY